MIALFRARKQAAPNPATPPPPRSLPREWCETAVFVVALVLLLKLFVVEAFVIPTGSMAETLYGYQKTITCPDCGHVYPVNASDEVDPQDGLVRPVTASTCPNCRFRFTGFGPPGTPQYAAPNSGDRVLVHKALYTLAGGPERTDVVVFKYPVDPQVNHSATNYIKRLWGLEGETLAIYRGDLYLNPALNYPADTRNAFGQPSHPRPSRPEQAWEGPMTAQHSNPRLRYVGDNVDYTYNNAEVALEAFEQSRQALFAPGNPGGFTLYRKSDTLSLAMRRIVYDADHQSETLSKAGVPPRWGTPPGWTPNDPRKPTAYTHAGPDRHTLTYLHRVSGPPTESTDAGRTPLRDPQGNRLFKDDWAKLADANQWQDNLFAPAPILNFLGYNSGEERGGARRPGNGTFWAPDLMLECEATISGPTDEVTLDLARGQRRFLATFTGGRVNLQVQQNGTTREVADAPTPLTAAGKFSLRFSNFDSRLRVTVNDKPVDFGLAADLKPWVVNATEPDGYTPANDLEPAKIHAQGTVTVQALKLWQDTYYTPAENQPYANPNDPIDTFYVQPGHYLCLGDNSGFSSDSRKWGLVPDRLLLGKASAIFWPGRRVGLIK